jgi:2-succinyl-5-enolpyruvyl-6-hydroxy-3-cyclohexene-1-carboxylate synthase
LKHNHTIFVIDNNGGGIFSTLPQAGVDGFEKVFGTPHNLNIESIIRGFGLSVAKIKSVSDIHSNLRHPSLHFVVVEVPSRESNAKALKVLYQSVASAVRIGINLA